MTTLCEAAQQALEILERLHGGCTDSDDGTVEAITIWVPEIIDALRAALAEPVQQGCDHCNHPLYAAVKCRVCGRVTEPVQEPVAIVGTQEDTWKGYGGQWAPPGPPIKTVHMLRELPEGTLLYAAPPQRPAEPVQEPQGCDHCNHPLYAATKCRVCGRVTEPVQEPVAWIHTDPDRPRVKFLEWRENEPGYRGDWIKTPLYTAPPQRKPLTEEEEIQAALAEPEPCQYPDCVDNGPEGKCIRWLVGECEGPKIGLQP